MEKSDFSEESAFQEELKEEDKKGTEEQKVKVCDKPAKSYSFVRNWGGWERGGD